MPTNKCKLPHLLDEVACMLIIMRILHNLESTQPWDFYLRQLRGDFCKVQQFIQQFSLSFGYGLSYLKYNDCTHHMLNNMSLLKIPFHDMATSRVIQWEHPLSLAQHLFNSHVVWLFAFQSSRRSYFTYGLSFTTMASQHSLMATCPSLSYPFLSQMACLHFWLIAFFPLANFKSPLTWFYLFFDQLVLRLHGLSRLSLELHSHVYLSIFLAIFSLIFLSYS